MRRELTTEGMEFRQRPVTGPSGERSNADREALAEYAHKAWSGWIAYMFEKGKVRRGRLILPKWATERWKRQMETPYEFLPGSEKESDRAEADAIMDTIDET